MLDDESLAPALAMKYLLVYSIPYQFQNEELLTFIDFIFGTDQRRNPSILTCSPQKMMEFLKTHNMSFIESSKLSTYFFQSKMCAFQSTKTLRSMLLVSISSSQSQNQLTLYASHLAHHSFQKAIKLIYILLARNHHSTLR